LVSFFFFFLLLSPPFALGEKRKKILVGYQKEQSKVRNYFSSLSLSLFLFRERRALNTRRVGSRHGLRAEGRDQRERERGSKKREEAEKERERERAAQKDRIENRLLKRRRPLFRLFKHRDKGDKKIKLFLTFSFELF